MIVFATVAEAKSALAIDRLATNVGTGTFSYAEWKRDGGQAPSVVDRKV